MLVEQLRGGVALSLLPDEVHLQVQGLQGDPGLADQQQARGEQETGAADPQGDGHPGVLAAADRHQADGHAGGHEEPQGPVEPGHGPLQHARAGGAEVQLGEEHPALRLDRLLR